MISIQDLGISILSDTPGKFYVLGGGEFGVKDKYLDHLEKKYGCKYEYAKVSEVISTMGRKHLIPLEPALYVVRYDEEFVSTISESIADSIRRSKIIGTLVCIYTEPKHISKLDKYLPEYVGVVESVNPKFIEKYLHSDFPNLDDRSIKIAVAASENYGHARNVCRSMMNADLTVLNSMSEADLISLFGCKNISSEGSIQQAVAARNFAAFCHALDDFSGDLDTVPYIFLQTMIELEKSKSTKYSNSPVKDYAKYWTVQDIYYMFMNAYQELSKLRTNTSSDVFCSLIYLAGLLTFKQIPSPEVMNGA